MIIIRPGGEIRSQRVSLRRYRMPDRACRHRGDRKWRAYQGLDSIGWVFHREIASSPLKPTGSWVNRRQSVPNYLGVLPRFASSSTDFVVADLSIVDLVGRPYAAGGFVICLANTR
jgi:hypothetical protein